MREHYNTTTSVPHLTYYLILLVFNLETLTYMISITSTKDEDDEMRNMEVDYVISYSFTATGKFCYSWLQRTMTDAEKRKQRRLRTLRNWSRL